MSLWTQIAALLEQNLIAFRDTNNWHILKSAGLDPGLWAYPPPPPPPPHHSPASFTAIKEEPGNPKQLAELGPSVF